MSLNAVMGHKIDKYQASLVDAFGAGAERPPHRQFHGRCCQRPKHGHVSVYHLISQHTAVRGQRRGLLAVWPQTNY